MNELDSLFSSMYGAYAQTEVGPRYTHPSDLEQSDDFQSHVPIPAPGLALAPNPRSRCGRKAFGYYPGENEVIQRIMELRAQGFGFDRLAEKLNQESVRSRSGKIWHGRVVNRIIKAQFPKN